MFLPTTPKELDQLNWPKLDVILVTGDAYIDSPFIGVAIIGKVLVDKGFRVGIIAQPDMNSKTDISRLGEPDLFWGITGGCVDSMVANYTALKKRRKKDDYTPGGMNTRRPDRAVIAYSNLVRKYFKKTRPIVLGGIEASLRRVAHYDFWSNKMRRSILFDAKADYLLFGMAHSTIVKFATALKENKPPEVLNGVAFISKEKKGKELPSFEAVQKDKKDYIKSFHMFYQNNDPITAQRLCQQHNDRYLILNPPEPFSTTKELDHIHSLGFERDLHPFHKKAGTVRALDTIRFSIPTHYGCYGECNFCAISVHQGRTIRYRSEESIIKEAADISHLEDFKGYITDLGGPTANMYGFECKKKLKKGACLDKRCLFPSPCKSLAPDHSNYIRLIQKVEKLPGIKKVFISSGIRYDIILNDKKNGGAYLEKIVNDNVSGQLKIAPEHTMPHVLNLMGKQPVDLLLKFKWQFDALSKQSGKKQFLTYYLIAAHPGCRMNDMKELKKFTTQKLKVTPEQVQVFTPAPSTYSTLMYYTGLDPFSMTPLFVEKNPKEKEKQKKIVTVKSYKPYGKKGN
ncbi:YgiQ family radical SAM protein [Desulfobacula toluolica]|uniref:Radical SAM protein n=1 Tax=Desulfobacula toluolica (strain DSM 7467 / Tol2) TaxID=651182 RepID=K0NCT9_DESTT|nr:YgiQ family radical SAM protein [Desulfobacula toluolica]CCK78505.1 radical SAM protein [Desulfobacula toluolica Tol2]